MKRVLTVLAAAMLAACAGTPPDAGPAHAIEPLPTLAPSRSASVVDGLAIDHWWTLFGDAELDRLVAQALMNNHDLAIAAARVREARARLDEAHAVRLPSLDLQAQETRARQSGDAGLPPGSVLARARHQASLVAQYDLDLWGRLASANDAARERLNAKQWARAAIEWSLTAQLAETHFSLRAVQRQLEIGAAVRTSRAQARQLRQQELAVGISNEFELRRAEAELAAADASIVALQRQRVALQSTIALLTAMPLAEVAQDAAPPVPLDTASPFETRLPRGDMAELLVRRPDLREAESELVATHADLAAARAATLPALRLSGSVGSDAQSMANLFSGPGFVWSVAVGLTQSLFDGGANRARVAEADARRDAATAQYRKAVLAAVVELREAYAALDLNTQAQQVQRERVAALGRALRLARIGVDAGALPRIDLLDAERNAFQAQLDEVAAHRDRLVGVVTVMKALGGGHSGASAIVARTDSSPAY